MPTPFQPSHPATFLVIEDDAAIGACYAELLELSGYQVCVAASGQAALAQVIAQPIHGILLDRRLPDMDGVWLCHHLREQITPNVPIVFITADDDPAIEVAARAAGATDFLPKPFALDVLLKRIAALFMVDNGNQIYPATGDGATA